MAVLKVLQDEQLQQHARRIGEYLLSQLAPIEQVRTLDMQRACTARGGPLSREGIVARHGWPCRNGTASDTRVGAIARGDKAVSVQGDTAATANFPLRRCKP